MIMSLCRCRPGGAEAPADWATLRSPENYTGNARTENFASPGGILPGQPHHYTARAELRLNHWALAGDWTIQEEAARLDTADGRIACRFQARDLNLVMGPAAPGTPTRFRVLLDGRLLGPQSVRADTQLNSRTMTSAPRRSSGTITFR